MDMAMRRLDSAPRLPIRPRCEMRAQAATIADRQQSGIPTKLVCMRCIPLLLVCVLWFIAPQAYPWGGDGHRAIAEAARGMLTPEARAKIEKILGNDDLAAIAGWLDDVRLAKKHRSGPLKDDPEAKEFNARFPMNEVWHYVDLPVGFTKYSETALSASNDDIVHAIHHAIDVLEGKVSDMTHQQALRVLVHLVGDAHQPLHSAAGYFDCSDPQHPKLVSDPEIARSKPHDRGGNQLFYTNLLQLHALWDNEIVKELARAVPDRPLAQQVAEEAKKQYWHSIDDYHYWPQIWIEDSAMQAIEVYRGITFGQATMRADGTIDRIEITLPNQFSERQLPMAKVQMAKAALHLASLLNSIRLK